MLLMLPYILTKLDLDVACMFLFIFCHLFAFLLQVMHTYQGQSDVELTLSIGDYVVVRKV